MYNQITNCACCESLIYAGIHFLLSLNSSSISFNESSPVTLLASSEAGKGLPVICFFIFFRKMCKFHYRTWPGWWYTALPWELATSYTGYTKWARNPWWFLKQNNTVRHSGKIWLTIHSRSMSTSRHDTHWHVSLEPESRIEEDGLRCSYASTAYDVNRHWTMAYDLSHMWQM